MPDEPVAPCYATVKAACLRAAGAPKRRKKKSKKRKEQHGTGGDDAGTEEGGGAEEDAIRAVLQEVFAAVPGRLGRGWTDERVSLAAAALSRAAAATSIARMKVTKKQFFQAYMGIAWLCLVGQQEFLFKDFGASETEAELRHLRDNPTTTFTTWVLERRQGVGDLLASHSWRGQIDAAMLALEQEKMKAAVQAGRRKAKRNSVGSGDDDTAWIAACVQAYARRDAYGDMGWSRPVNTNLLQGGAITIVRDPTTGFYTAERARPNGGTTRYVHTSDKCADLEECEALIEKGLPLDHHTVSRMAKAKTALKLMGCVKARVTGALPSNTCCKHSADQIGSCFEVLWTAHLCSMVLKLRPFPGDPSVANFPTPFMWLRAVLAGADVDALKAERRRHKRVDAAAFYGLCPEKRWEKLIWPCLREEIRYEIKIKEDAELLGGERVVAKSFPDIFPRVRADPPVLAYNKEVSRSKAQIFAEDYRTAALQHEGGWAPDKATRRAYEAGEQWVAQHVDLDAAFDALHGSFADQLGQATWDEVFGDREIVVRDNGRVAVVHTYGTIRNAGEVFARHRLPETVPDAWVANLTSQSIKVLDISGSNLCVQVSAEVLAKCNAREVRYGGGRLATKTRRILYHDTACPRCKQPLCTGFFVPREAGFVCAVCKFAEFGPFDPRSPFATTKVADADGLHAHPPWWHRRAHADRSDVFYIHHKTTNMSAVLIEDDQDEAIVTFVEFSVPVTRFVFAASRKQLGSSVPLPEALDLSTAQVRRTAIRDHRPWNERDETVCVQVFQEKRAAPVRGVVPTKHGVAAFFVWLTLRKGAMRHKRHISVGPNGEMNGSSLRRAFSIFMAERLKCDSELLATYDALTAELETEHVTQHELNEVLNNEALDWGSAPISPPPGAGGDGGASDDDTCAATCAFTAGPVGCVDARAISPPRPIV